MLHILYTPTISTPPWATHERLANCAADEIVIADCCLCKMRADETVCVISRAPDIPKGLTRKEWEDWVYGNAAYFYDPAVTITCGEGFGCKANPRRLIGRHLRERW